MLSRLDIVNLVEEAFSSSSMREAFVEKISEAIDYESLADDFFSTFQEEIESAICEAAEEALE